MILLAAVLAGCATVLAMPQPSRPPRSDRRVGLGPLIPAIAVGMGFAGAGLVGVVGAIALVLVLHRRARTAGERADLRRRGAEERELPAVASLLAALLSSGATVEAAVEAIARSHRGALTRALQRVHAAMTLGAPPDQAWAAGSATLAPIAEALSRSAGSGAPAAGLLADAAAEQQRIRRARADVAARAAGVRAVLPLVACFLPAFLLVGVVPVIASVAGSLLR